MASACRIRLSAKYHLVLCCIKFFSAIAMIIHRNWVILLQDQIKNSLILNKQVMTCL